MLEKRLKPLGWPRERRRFHPHITLARVRLQRGSTPPEELLDLISKFEAREFGAAAVERIQLFRSELTPAGANYTVLETVELPS